MKIFSRGYKIIKKLYFLIYDFVICFLHLNKKNNQLKTKKRVIWLAETGSRDFIPRLAQAISLWIDYQIPSLVIHKHFLKKLEKNILVDAVVIDKSATINCVRRLRYSKLNGSYNIVIPEELLICDQSEEIIKGTLHSNTLKYVDAVVCESKNIINYLKIIDKSIKTIKALNPRLSFSLIEKNCKFLETAKNKIKKEFNNGYILINDKLSLKFSTYENEIEMLKNNIFKSTKINGKKYVNNLIKQEEKEEKLLINLIKKIREEDLFNHLRIIIRPHPTVDIEKYSIYFDSKLDKSFNYSIVREGTAIEWMESAVMTFHCNCTTAIEGYFKRINNIYNFSSEYRKGTTDEFINILNPLGLESAILMAKQDYLNPGQSYSKSFKNLTSYKNIYKFLGEEMESGYKFTKVDYSLANKFKNVNIQDYSVADRWKEAAIRIKDLSKNNMINKNFPIKTLGSIGVQIGIK